MGDGGDGGPSGGGGASPPKDPPARPPPLPPAPPPAPPVDQVSELKASFAQQMAAFQEEVKGMIAQVVVASTTPSPPAANPPAFTQLPGARTPSGPPPVVNKHTTPSTVSSVSSGIPTPGDTFMQMKVVQSQTARAERAHAVLLDTILWENMATQHGFQPPSNN